MDEYVSLNWAIAWIITGDERFAQHCRDQDGIIFALTVSNWTVQNKTKPHRHFRRSRQFLLSECERGRILAKGYLRLKDANWPANGNYWTFGSKCERIDPADWLSMKIDGKDAEPKRGDDPYYRSPVFRRADLMRQFMPPRIADMDDIPLSTVVDPNPPVSAGAPAALTTTKSQRPLIRKHRGAASLANPDAPFVEKMRVLIGSGSSLNAASEIVFAEHANNIPRQPRASDDSVKRRLRERYKSTFGTVGE